MKTEPSWLVLTQAYLAASSPLLPRDSQETQIGSIIRTRAPAPFRDPSPNIITPHTIRLNRVSARSSTAYEASGISPRSHQSSSSIFPKFGEGILDPVMQTTELAADVTIANQTFKLIFDTGSSDLWVAGEDYRCIAPNRTVISNSKCNFTTTFKGTYSGGEIPGQHFAINYGGGQFIAGTLGYESVSVAGITIPDQEISIANRVNFQAQGEISGLIGFAYPQDTNAFPGNESLIGKKILITHSHTTT
ncbi:eukaryotic aspartyl protease [Trichoderma arundinaceum]|uniref:Eukaryotic aspartyl protease n=1 Tax=Trichoderma arundinaceum TaxID=490622 RepID=A0A395NQV1_TRIAR|nr:eukaryotic aspartyl protease [Trichoderma arundinaceum]